LKDMIEQFKKAPWWAKTILAAAAVIAVLAIIGSALGSEDDGNDAVVATAPTRVVGTPDSTTNVDPTPATQQTESPSWASGAPLSGDSIREALRDGDELTRSLNIGQPRTVEVDGTAIYLTYRAEDARGETDLLTVGAQTSFSAHRALFSNPLVQSVTVTVVADWVDQFGATTEDVTTVSTLDRATVDERIDWGGLKGRVIGDNKIMFCVSDAYNIHRGIYSRLGDLGCLEGAIRVG